MHEGAFRVLHTLADRERRRRPALARASGEAESVLRELLGRYPKWFEEEPEGVRATDVGLAALATELAARHPLGQLPTGSAEDAQDPQRAAFAALAASGNMPTIVSVLYRALLTL